MNSASGDRSEGSEGGEIAKTKFRRSVGDEEGGGGGGGGGGAGSLSRKS